MKDFQSSVVIQSQSIYLTDPECESRKAAANWTLYSRLVEKLISRYHEEKRDIHECTQVNIKARNVLEALCHLQGEYV